MNDLNFAALTAARQAATQARQPNPAQDRALDPRTAASAFDAAMARASRDEASRNADTAAETRRARQPERNAEARSQGSERSREAQDTARHGMADRTRAQGDGETTAGQESKAVQQPAPKSPPKSDKSRGEAQDTSQAAQDPIAAPGMPAMPVAPVLTIPESTAAAAAAASAPAAAVATPQPAADEPDLESLSTVIRSDDPLADSLATPRGLARALPPEMPVAHGAKGKETNAANAAADDVARATPFERLIEVTQRETAAVREFGAAIRANGAAEASAPARVDGTIAAASMFAPAAPATYSVAHGSVSAPVGQAAFAEEFAQRVVMFSSQKVHNAQIALSPAELGPISIAIEVRGQEAHLNFNAAHATTRAAIEDALPKLREMFANHGLQLANANVGDQPAQRDYGRPQRGDASQVPSVGAAASSGGPNAAAAIDTQTMRTNWLRSDRLIDIVV